MCLIYGANKIIKKKFDKHIIKKCSETTEEYLKPIIEYYIKKAKEKQTLEETREIFIELSKTIHNLKKKKDSYRSLKILHIPIKEEIRCP